MEIGATVNPDGHVAIIEDDGRMREALSFQLGTWWSVVGKLRTSRTDLGSGHHPPARHHRLLVHVQPCTPFMENSHSRTSSSHAAGVKPASSDSTNRAPGPVGPWQQ